ncbi:MAG: ATP-binding cassette domain-containing protein [Ruminococcus sp.]|jgi:ABC-type sugar transport system ATPase subunit
MRDELLRIENGIYTVNGYDILAGIQFQIYKNQICGMISAEQKEMEELWKILQGKEILNYGIFYINEKKIEVTDAAEVLASNVMEINGYSQLIQGLSLAENMFVMREGQERSLIHMEEMEKKLQILFDQFSLSLDIHTPVTAMSRLERYQFELIKAYMRGIRLVLLDLRSSDLTFREAEKLFDLIEKMKGRNITFVVWNPILYQLIRFSDQLVILKNGKTARFFERSEFDEKTISLILLGNVDNKKKEEVLPKMGIPVFQIKSVSDSYLYNISLNVKAGEICFVHCENAEGMSHLYQILSGETQPESGYMLIGKETYHPLDMEDAVGQGVGFIEDSTFSRTLFYNMTVFENICLVKGNFLKAIWRRRRYRESLKKTINQWFQKDICGKKLSTLSETELQKVLFCRWLLYRPRLLVLVNPFIGGCINMNEASMDNIRQIAEQGTGILILSTNELPYPILNESRKVLTSTGELKERIHVL